MQRESGSNPMLFAEIARRQIQQRLFSQTMGWLIPEVVSLPDIKDVLEPMCGPGAWIIDVAQAYPKLQITGMESEAGMIRYAAEHGYGLGLKNILFQKGDLHKRLPCAAESFDFLQLQNVSAAIRPSEWPLVMKELWRILRPGGWIHLIDMEVGPVSSPALERLNILMGLAIMRGAGESEVATVFSSALLYPRLLAEAGCVDVKYTLKPVNLGGFDVGGGVDFVLARLTEDGIAVAFLKRMQLIDPLELDQLLKTVRQEVQQIDFCGTGMLISVTGTKRRI